MDSGRMVKKVYRSEMKGGRSRGRVRTRWKDEEECIGKEEQLWEVDVEEDRTRLMAFHHEHLGLPRYGGELQIDR